MKTINNSGVWQVTSDRKKTSTVRGGKSCHPSPVTRHPSAFTLVELLVVISIIAVLASFAFPVLSRVKRNQYINQTRAEMGQLAAAIDNYKTTYGFYPPGNSKYDPSNPATSSDAMFSPLYFELLGTTNINNATYQTLDGSASILVSALAAPGTSPLGVGGFVNCSKPGAGEDARAARNFLPGLNPNRYGLHITNNIDTADPVALLLGAAGGPDLSYQPLNASGVNPWRYVSPGVNNPTSYDLWIQLSIGGKMNLVCNWSKQVQLNSPLP